MTDDLHRYPWKMASDALRLLSSLPNDDSTVHVLLTHAGSELVAKFDGEFWRVWSRDVTVDPARDETR